MLRRGGGGGESDLQGLVVEEELVDTSLGTGKGIGTSSIHRVVDLHHFNANPDSAVHFSVDPDPDPAFYFNADLDPEPN